MDAPPDRVGAVVSASAHFRLRLPLAISAFAPAVLLAGCDRPNAASEANFTRALGPLVADAFCHSLPMHLMATKVYDGETPPALPLMVASNPADNQLSNIDDVRGRAMLDAAVAQGLLTRTTTTAPARPTDQTVPLKPTALTVYTPTSAGQAMFRAVSREAADHRDHLYPAVCLGRGRIDKIVRWTEPADMFGRTMSQVTYHYTAADMPAILPAAIRAKAAAPQEATATLVRTNGGWQPAR